MAIKIFGWEIRKYRPEKQFTSDDRLASFILMAMTEKVNRLFTPHGFTVQVTDEERKQYVLDGKVPYRIAVAAVNSGGSSYHGCIGCCWMIARSISRHYRKLASRLMHRPWIQIC